MQTRGNINSVRNMMAPTDRTDALRVKQQADATIQSAAVARTNCEQARCAPVLCRRRLWREEFGVWVWSLESWGVVRVEQCA